MSAFLARAGEFGHLGSQLRDLLLAQEGLVESFDGLSLVQRLVRLHGSTSALRSVDPLLPAAISLLCVDYPMQTRLGMSDVLGLVRLAYDWNAFDTIETVEYIPERGGALTSTLGRRSYYSRLGWLVGNDRAFRERFFPTKKFGAAAIKVHLRLGSLARALTKTIGVGKLGKWVAHCVGLTNDQVCGALLYAQCLEEHFGELGWRSALAAVRYPSNAKGLSNALKALGANSTSPGALFVEAGALLGRGQGTIDLGEETRYRCDPALVSESVIDRAEELRPHIRAILERETHRGRSPLPDINHWWSGRWLWCVNGSQNHLSDVALGIHNPAGKRRYRKMAAEEVIDEPITAWDGTVTVSPSAKLECGKTRAIFACDTRSYFAFSWLLSTVERDWVGERVLLNPGVGGSWAVARRVLGHQRGGGVNLMLDYDDFNSQHSLGTMKTLFEELCDLYAVPAWYKEKLVGSFDKTWVRCGGQWQRVLGTLMSGHRATTFINTVMNAAYIRAAVGGPTFDKMRSLHAGDDVYMRLDTLGACAHVLIKCAEFGCRMNPTKQSIGFHGSEFLRMGINREYAIGYLCRSLSTLVAGSWVEPDPLVPEEALKSAISTCRSAINRGAPLSIAVTLAHAYRGIPGVGDRKKISLFTGRVALEGSPVYNSDQYIRTVRVIKTARPPEALLPPGYRKWATQAYLESHVSPVEARAIEMASVDLTAIMVASSYSKSSMQLEPFEAERSVRLTRVRQRPALGYAEVSELASRHVDKGLLTQYPLIRLVEGRLGNEELGELLSMLGVSVDPSVVREYAFGRESHSCNIIGTLPHSDASHYSRKTTSDNIIVVYSIRM